MKAGIVSIILTEEFGLKIHMKTGDMASIHIEAGEVSKETYFIHKTETNSVKKRLQRIHALAARRNKKLMCVFLDS